MYYFYPPYFQMGFEGSYFCVNNIKILSSVVLSELLGWFSPDDKVCQRCGPWLPRTDNPLSPLPWLQKTTLCLRVTTQSNPCLQHDILQ